VSGSPTTPSHYTDETNPPVLTALVSLGTWKGPVPVPTNLSFESLTTSLTGEDKEMFLNFLSGLLCWLPEERLTAEQIYCHLWLRGGGEK
jgi:serine/threonine protein kinase